MMASSLADNSLYSKSAMACKTTKLKYYAKAGMTKKINHNRFKAKM